MKSISCGVFFFFLTMLNPRFDVYTIFFRSNVIIEKDVKNVFLIREQLYFQFMFIAHSLYCSISPQTELLSVQL